MITKFIDFVQLNWDKYGVSNHAHIYMHKYNLQIRVHVIKRVSYVAFDEYSYN